MKHILRSLPLGKPFCPHCLASHSSKHSLHALFTTHQIHIHGHRVAPWCVAPVRPPTLRSRPHGRPLRAARRLPARVPPSLPRSHRSFPTFTMRETERARDGRARAGRKITHGAAADVTLYTITCDPWARQGWEGWVASTPKQESQHLPSLLGSISPLASSLPLLLFISFISTEQCMRGTCYGNGWHACAWTHNTARSGCCSSGLPRENESGFW